MPELVNMSNEIGSKQSLTIPPQRSGILSISRDAEVLQSFLRVDLGLDDEGDVAPKRALSEEISPPPQSRPQEGVMERREREKARLNKVPSNKTKVGKTTFSQLTKDIKLKQGGEGVKKKKKGGGSKAARIRLQEEVYTDKDRAAAVVMGSRDIKQSLKMKRKQDRSLALQIPEEAEPGTLLALGSREMRSGDVSIAINFMHKALELNPNDKNALVARSKCYLLLGEPNLALKDAETALQGDKTFIRGRPYF
ncbi:unnamed protein product, partial [Timema podura]|nr:unnamed protein product [Timema podura]